MQNKIGELKHELLSYQELEDTYHSVSLWVLNTSLHAGDTIHEEDCTKIILKTQDVTPFRELASAESLEGFSAKTALSEGCVLTEEMFYPAEDFTENSKLLELSDLILPSWVSTHDLIDIRIRFPNGEDYIVISHQKVKKLLTDETETYGLQLELTEEDLLRLSSARVDWELYSGCDIYITKYVMDFQEASQKDYPVNPDVFTLMQWDPNIITLFTVESEQEKRELLESHLEGFLQKGTIGEADFSESTSRENNSTEDTSKEDDSEDSLTVYHP
ncbi:MAG: hypothetical protein ACI4ES_08150 [Roseburia sp.]